MKIYILRENVDGSILRCNHNRWWSGSIFQDANTPDDEQEWHIFGRSDILAPTHSSGPWGRFRRVIHPFLISVVKSYRNHGALNDPSVTKNSYNWKQPSLFTDALIKDIQREWPELLDKNNTTISLFNKDAKDYINTVAACYLELIESEFGTTMINPLPLAENATKALKRNHTKLMNDRASGRPVHN